MFDLFFPQQYPGVPPLMHFDTNGQGRARMNPNLYADGKASPWRLLYAFSRVAYTCGLYMHWYRMPSNARAVQRPVAW